MEKEYEYTVCTRCMTFNHAPYIEDTLKGFAIQKVSFPVVYCIIDDASTDGEQDLLRKWADDNLDFDDIEARHENLDYGELYVAPFRGEKAFLFSILLLRENHYRKKPKLPYIAEWNDNAKYFALCEGDDYWIDPLKLQKQVDFLEKFPEYGMCYTQVKYLVDNKLGLKSYGGPSEDLDDLLLKNNTIPTVTTLFRSDLDKQYINVITPRIRKWKMGDYPRWLWFAAESKIHFESEVTAVYRILPESASHSSSFDKSLMFTKSFYDIKFFFNERYSLDYEEKLKRSYHTHIMYKTSSFGDFSKTRKEFLIAIKEDIRSLLCFRNFYYLVLALVKRKTII